MISGCLEDSTKLTETSTDKNTMVVWLFCCLVVLLNDQITKQLNN